MNVNKVELPASSRLNDFINADDFLDCYAVESSLSPRDAAEIALSFPWWVRCLMTLRNILVKPFGLTTEADDAREKLGIFPLDSETENELIAGFNDKHLEFRLSVLSHEGRIHLATWVKTHNLGGRLYLAAVMPFHIVIIRSALNRVARRAPANP